MITITDAPESYDGFGTVTRATIGVTRKGAPVRQVATPAEHSEWQRMRYASGMYLRATEDRWREVADLLVRS